jgi:DNA-directed RNA polymerase subunit RPC12/RpoP
MEIVQYKYRCSYCSTVFNRDKSESKSRLVQLTIKCKMCGSTAVEYTEWGKLLAERLQKIKKLNDKSRN